MNQQTNGVGYMFRPAIREATGLLIGLAGPSGSGKTYSAMRLATGIVGSDTPFGVIDTENRRSRHYADFFNFEVVDLLPPYRPNVYLDAIDAGIKAGYKALVIDSMSHEHAGEGGVLEWQAEILEELIERAKEREPATPEWKLAERYNMKSWIEPKMSRKKAIQKMLFASTSIPIIVCFRAEEKLFIRKDDKGKTEMATEWAPVCGKEYPYEMTCFLMLSIEKPGYPRSLKLQEQHRHLFPHDKQIDEDAGRRIYEWSKGNENQTPKEPKETHTEKGPSPEEEREAQKQAGMVPKRDEEFDKKGSFGEENEATILNRLASEISKFKTKKETQEYYQANRKPYKEKYSERIFFEWTKLVNDKLERLKN